METEQLRVLAIEIFKTVNNLNPNYVKGIFTQKLHPKVKLWNCNTNRINM